MKIRILLLACLIAAASAMYGQKIKQLSGSLPPLKGEKTLNIQYVYDGLHVGEMQESDYIKKKVTEYNSKEPGKGDKWKENWFNDRKTRYQPKFEELFNKYLEEIGMAAKEGATDARYTVIVKTIMIEPGFNVGVMRRPARIEVEMIIIETNKPEVKIAEFSVVNIPGADVMGYDFDSGLRISEAYAKLGKEFGKYIGKNIK
jgi:hypothetical protein